MDELRRLALDLATNKKPTANHINSVAEVTSPEAASWAFTQWKLRFDARAKFGQAASMLFVREALEQATDERLAAYHAQKFPEGVRVADLTAGIGSDTIALARRGPVSAYELDAERAECARHNLEGHELSAEVKVQDCLSADWDFEYAFADPSRRVDGRRTLDPEMFEPDPSTLAERFRGLELAGLKLSPMLQDAYLNALGGALEFVSLKRECREALVWLGRSAGTGVEAVHIESGARLRSDDEDVPAVPYADQYLYEADPAAIRAHALGALCRQTGLRALAETNGFLVGRREVESPWLRAYRSLYQCSGDDKTTNEALKGMGAHVTAIKVRGGEVDVEKAARKYRRAGSRGVVLVVYFSGRARHHLIVEPIARG